jgi:hypothetical protein
MRRTRVLGADRQTPGADLATAHHTMPPVAQVGAVQSDAARQHLRGLNRRDRAQPSSSGSGVLFLALLMIVGVSVALVLAATGTL